MSEECIYFVPVERDRVIVTEGFSKRYFPKRGNLHNFRHFVSRLLLYLTFEFRKKRESGEAEVNSSNSFDSMKNQRISI